KLAGPVCFIPDLKDAGATIEEGRSRGNQRNTALLQRFAVENRVDPGELHEIGELPIIQRMRPYTRVFQGCTAARGPRPEPRTGGAYPGGQPGLPHRAQ